MKRNEAPLFVATAFDGGQMKNCTHCSSEHGDLPCVARVPIFAGLLPTELDILFEKIRHVSFRKGDCLIREGDDPQSLYIVHTGHLKATQFTPDGREQILYLYKEGEFFGEQFILSGHAAEYDVRALDDGKCCLLRREDFLSVLSTNPVISMRIIETLGRRMSDMESTLRSLGVRNVDARLASFLLRFSDHSTKSIPVVTLPVGREDMAGYLGLARETVSRKLRSLEESKVIEILGSRKISILNEEELRRIAGEDYLRFV